MRLCLAVVLFSVSLSAQNSCGTGSTWFASSVASFLPGPGVTAGIGFGQPSRILCAPNGSTDVLSLGAGGTVVLGFDAPLTDGPGTDFVVWENPFAFSGQLYSELAFVEVSTDGVVFARFPSTFLGAVLPIGAFGGLPVGTMKGLAGASLFFTPPSIAAYLDPVLAGGDAFDLDELALDPAVLAGAVNLAAVNFVRLVDIVGDGSTQDTAGRPIYDPWTSTSTDSADFDAVAVVNNQLNQDPNAPAVTVAFDAATRRLTLVIADADGLLDATGPVLAALNQIPFDIGTVLNAFAITNLTGTMIALESVPIPLGIGGTLTLSIYDQAGRRGTDTDLVLP